MYIISPTNTALFHSFVISHSPTPHKVSSRLNTVIGIFVNALCSRGHIEYGQRLPNIAGGVWSPPEVCGVWSLMNLFGFWSLLEVSSV